MCLVKPHWKKQGGHLPSEVSQMSVRPRANLARRCSRALMTWVMGMRLWGLQTGWRCWTENLSVEILLAAAVQVNEAECRIKRELSGDCGLHRTEDGEHCNQPAAAQPNAQSLIAFLSRWKLLAPSAVVLLWASVWVKGGSGWSGTPPSSPLRVQGGPITDKIWALRGPRKFTILLDSVPAQPCQQQFFHTMVKLATRGRARPLTQFKHCFERLLSLHTCAWYVAEHFTWTWCCCDIGWDPDHSLHLQNRDCVFVSRDARLPSGSRAASGLPTHWCFLLPLLCSSPLLLSFAPLLCSSSLLLSFVDFQHLRLFLYHKQSTVHEMLCIHNHSTLNNSEKLSKSLDSIWKGPHSMVRCQTYSVCFSAYYGTFRY